MLASPRALGAALAMAAAMSTSTIAAAAERPSLDLRIRDLAERVFTSEFKACKTHGGQLTKLIADAEFVRQPPSTQGLAYMAAIACSGPDDARALSAARSLVALPVEPAMAWFGHSVLLDDAERREALDDYLTHLYAMIDGEPAEMAGWDVWRLQWVLTKVRADPVREVQLLDKLHAVPWTNQALQSMDRNGWAVIRARRLVETGERSRARSALQGVTRVDDLLTVAQDRRFEPLWQDLEADGRFAWVAIAEADLAEHRLRMAAQPNTLEPVADVIGGLRSLGRHDEAVALGEAYAARLRKGDTFTDATDYRSWMLNTLAYALFDLGRYDEADKVVLEAVGEDKVSQTINRSEMLYSAGRPAESLKALDKVEAKQVSPYGLMWVQSGRACAQAQLGGKAAAEKELVALRPGWKTNADALHRALLCLDARDEAAALYVKRLEDPSERAGALSAFRTSLPPPIVPPNLAALEARDEAVRARPDVKAALAKWGRAVKVPLIGDF